MATVEEDRKYVIGWYDYAFGRKPNATELAQRVESLQKGMSRIEFERITETWDRDASIIRIYNKELGRPPTAQEIAWHSNGLKIGRTTRASLTEHLQGSSEFLLREPADTPTPDEDDARVILTKQLEEYGLGGLSDWAWTQIQAGHTKEQIHQELVKTPEYQTRFAGMKKRQDNNLSSISENDYIAYETQVRQLMRKAGMPDTFYDSPDDFADMIGKDISAMEVQSRIEEGYLAATNAPEGVRNKLASLYGVNTSQVAAYYLDPDRALPILQRQLGASGIANAAALSSYGDITKQQAENLDALGVDSGEATKGFGALASSAELFNALPGERLGDITRDEQMGAIFNSDAEAIAKIEKKAGSRRSAGSGSQSFAVGEGGVSGLGRQ